MCVVGTVWDRHHEALYGGGDFEAEFTPKTAVEEDEIQRELEDRMVDEMKLQARKRSVHQPSATLPFPDSLLLAVMMGQRDVLERCLTDLFGG